MARKPHPSYALPTAAHHLFYAVVRPYARWGFSLWYRMDRRVPGAHHLNREGHDGPARLIFGGHQNGLADPLLACVLLQPQLHFFTRADAFRERLARWCLLRLNMMPIFRPKDRVPDLAERNHATFLAAHQRLEAGATCGIFPEAGHLDERRIRRFRHGSARFIAGALQREPIRRRGLEVLPMFLDFERYSGYRTAARMALGQPIALTDIPGLTSDTGTARVELSSRMRAALAEGAVNLIDGPLYEVHLAVCRYLEGHSGGAPDRAALDRVRSKLEADSERALTDWASALRDGMGSPRQTDDCAAIGRIASGKDRQWRLQLWRFPAWLVFLVSAGWWPRIIGPAAARRVKDVSFHTTFSIPVNLIAVSLTWVVLALGGGVLTGHILAAPAILLVLRVCQHFAMPLEDAFIDARTERRMRPFVGHPFAQHWLSPSTRA